MQPVTPSSGSGSAGGLAPRAGLALSSLPATSATEAELQAELRGLRSQNAELIELLGRQVIPSGMPTNLAEGAGLGGGSIVQRVSSSSRLGLELEFLSNRAPESDGAGRLPLPTSASDHSSKVLLPLPLI